MNDPRPLFVLRESHWDGYGSTIVAATVHESILEILKRRYPNAAVCELPWQGDDEALVWGLR